MVKVVAVIHQPRYDTLQLFDDLILSESQILRSQSFTSVHNLLSQTTATFLRKAVERNGRCNSGQTSGLFARLAVGGSVAYAGPTEVAHRDCRNGCCTGHVCRMQWITSNRSCTSCWLCFESYLVGIVMSWLHRYW